MCIHLRCPYLKMTNQKGSSYLYVILKHLLRLREFIFLCGESLREFKKILVHIGHSTNTNLNNIILGIGKYFFHIDAISK